MFSRTRMRGFTLVEITIVIMIIGLMAGISGYAWHSWHNGSKDKSARALAEMLDLKKAGYLSDYGTAAVTAWTGAPDDSGRYDLLKPFLPSPPSSLGDGSRDGDYVPKGFKFELNGLNEPTKVFRLTSSTPELIYPAPPSGTSYQVTLAVNDSARGTALGGGVYSSSDMATITAIPFSGWRFGSWRESGSTVSGDASLTFAVTNNRNLTAVFEAVPAGNFSLTILRNNTMAGTVSPSGGSYTAGNSVTLNASNNPGWLFDSWSGDIGGSTSSNPSITVVMDRDRTIQANFVQATVALTVSANNPAYGSVSGGGFVPAGTSVSVTGTPYPGYQFVRWLNGATVVSTASVFSYTVNANTSLTAEFQSEPATGVIPGTYGDANNVSQIVVDANGRILDAQNVPIEFPDLGTMAKQDANAVAITGGSISGVTQSGSTITSSTVTSSTMTGSTIESSAIGTTNPTTGRFTSLSFTNTLGPKIALWGASSGSHYGMGIQSSLLQIYSDASGSDIAFGYGSSSAFTETARFRNSNGSLGLGTKTPTNRLTVARDWFDNSTDDWGGGITITGTAPTIDFRESDNGAHRWMWHLSGDVMRLYRRPAGGSFSQLAYFDGSGGLWTAGGATFTGGLSTDRIIVRSQRSMNNSNGSQVEVNNAGSGEAFISFHKEGVWGAHFGLDSDNWFSTRGWSNGSGGYNALRVGAFQADTFTDRNDGGYYVDPNGVTRLNTLRPRIIAMQEPGADSGITGDRPYEWGYQEGGAWAHPYPDLVIGYHTGLKLGGGSSYGGTRFYSDHPSRTGNMIFSVGEGDNNVRITNSLLVSTNNATGGGIILADDGDIVDLNDGYGSMRFSFGVRIFSGNRGGSPVITLGSNGAVTASTFVATSSARFKDNVAPMEPMLDKVTRLQGVRFTWTEGPKTGEADLGLIAEAVDEVFPEVVGKDASGQTTGVDYGRLSAVLIEAVKELKAENTSIAERLARAEAYRESTFRFWAGVGVGAAFVLCGTLVYRRKRR